jgi:hypothetical protein
LKKSKGSAADDESKPRREHIETHRKYLKINTEVAGWAPAPRDAPKSHFPENPSRDSHGPFLEEKGGGKTFRSSPKSLERELRPKNAFFRESTAQEVCQVLTVRIERSDGIDKMV